MTFNSVEQVKFEFNLPSDNLGELQKTLKKMRTQLHPDNNGGKFSSKEDEEKYLKVGQAIEYLDNKIEQSKSLVPISEIKDLIQIARELAPQDKVNNLEVKLSNQISSSISNLKSRHFLPKVTASSITAIITTLWMFPSIISEHPVMKNYIDITNDYFTVVWFLCLVTTIEMWLLITKKESQEKEFRTRLNTESVQNNLFENYLYYHDSISNYFETSKKEKLSKDDFIQFLTDRTHNRRYYSALGPFRFLRPAPIDIELAQSLANIIFVRAEEKNVIQKYNSPSLSDEYVLTDTYLKSKAVGQ